MVRAYLKIHHGVTETLKKIILNSNTLCLCVSVVRVKVKTLDIASLQGV